MNNQSHIIKGTCYALCPEEEINLRERENLVHILEVVNKKHKLVKCFSRSAADAHMAIPRLLRPFNILRDTVKHLLFVVAKRIDVPLAVMYDFLNDRLRAVRQDVTIQRLPPAQCLELLEPIIRFHVYFGYRLCEKPTNEFNPTLNKQYLLECIKWFLSSIDELEKSKYNFDTTILNLELLKLDEKDKDYDRVLIESLYILCNMDDETPMKRYLQLPKEIKRNPRLRLTYDIAISNLKGNYINVCRLYHRLCPLTACAFLTYLPVLQRRSLQKMSSAYNSKHLSIPTEVIQEWLLFNSISEAAECCKHYGLSVNGGVCFNKSAFKHEADIHRLGNNQTAAQITLQDILTY
ncbi:unnamed protein product [Leptosia nina]|uniref:SAC3/GANP/THP3 conserved domain-containing protein n=1 Tax=Leptosia nina TaxID=320188 RepID=A0AAV1JV97_9NEOP